MYVSGSRLPSWRDMKRCATLLDLDEAEKAEHATRAIAGVEGAPPSNNGCAAFWCLCRAI